MKKRLSFFFLGFCLLTLSPLHAAEDVPPLGSTPPPEVLKFLQEMKKQYGPDTVALISWLLDATNHSGSVLTSSVKVNGDEMKDNTKFLVFLVETGLILNERGTDQNGRLVTLWERILEKAFLHMDTIDIPADGIIVDLFYHHKAFPETDNLADHVDEPGQVEEAKFYFSANHLRAFMRKDLTPHELLSHTQIFVDNQPVVFAFPQKGQTAEQLHSLVDLNLS